MILPNPQRKPVAPLRCPAAFREENGVGSPVQACPGTATLAVRSGCRRMERTRGETAHSPRTRQFLSIPLYIRDPRLLHVPVIYICMAS